ncbi:MAG: hypothetical protein AAB776_01890 [Patescibacteria group bacterium]
MYFVFNNKESDAAEVLMVPIILKLQEPISIERTTRLDLLGVYEDLATAEEVQRKLRGLNNAVSTLTANEASSRLSKADLEEEGQPTTSPNMIYDVHLVWVRQRALTVESGIDDDGNDIGVAHGSLQLSFDPGDEFAIALATEVEEEAVALSENRELVLDCVYDVLDEDDEEEPDEAQPTPHGMTWGQRGEA